MKVLSRSIVTPCLVTVLLMQLACFSFSSELRAILIASPPLVNSLPLPQALKDGMITDFTELGGDAADMADAFKACGSDKPCKLNAVLKFEGQFETIDARGHFGTHPRLQTIEGILKGLIASAKIYYGGKANPTAMRGAKPVTEDSLKAQLKHLKEAMQP